MSIAQRLDDLDTALAALVAACDAEDLTALPGGELLEVARRVEGMRNRLPVLDHAFIRAAEGRSLAQTLAARNTRTLLAMALRITPAEATRRVRAAAALNPRRTLLGEALPPPRPVLAAAQRDGGVSAEQAEVILRTLTALQHSGQVDPTDVDRAEVTLVGYCDVFAPWTWAASPPGSVTRCTPTAPSPSRPRSGTGAG